MFRNTYTNVAEENLICQSTKTMTTRYYKKRKEPL